MQDFNGYAKGGKNNGGNNAGTNDIEKLVRALAGKFDGKSQSELIKAIYEQAKQGKERGTLTNRDIDNFVAMLSPMVDDKKRKMLNKIAEELKKI
ncbi:MAG: hypothetical protein IJV95_03985 [Clostridia bacterium]|nr:hypothetical protein [Clostridia bacterium]